MEWLPIETAPKDGTEFDAWGFTLPDSGGCPENPAPGRLTNTYWGSRDSQYVNPREGWVTRGWDGWAWAVEITHWMPLPRAADR